MSLNGLDNDAVVSAYQAALSEAGGWFLLKYASRDTVDLLDRGTGGVSEARRAIEHYEEKSPLYGLVQHRRKKIILKYVPDGTSRLLQVRLAVQFQSILDTFTPHDTVFSFTSADELSESALGLSRMMKSNESKSSSSSSLRQQRLNEIAEDNEESSSTEKASVSQAPTATNETKEEPKDEEVDGLPASAARAKALLAKRRQEALGLDASTASTPAPSTPTVPTPSVSEVVHPARESEQIAPFVDEKVELHQRRRSSTTASAVDKDLPAPPKDLPDLPGLPRERDATTSDRKISLNVPRPSIDFSLPPIDSDSDDDVRRPIPKQYTPVRQSTHLSAAESSSISKWTEDVVASTRSKQKRGSRESHNRPKTSGNNDDYPSTRLVANLPPSIRVSNRTSAMSSRPGSQQSTRSVPTRWAPSPNLPPPLPSPTFPDVPRRPMPQRPPSQTSSLAVDNPSITPEKMRLMKALQMRKRNQLLAQRAAPNTAATQNASNTLASMDSSKSGASTMSAKTTSSDGQTKDTVIKPPELASVNESETTSPTSITTASDNHSTKPSSLSDNSAARHSSTSLSSDTNSSTTPKANHEKKQFDQETPDHDIVPPTDVGIDHKVSVQAEDIKSQPESQERTAEPAAPVEESLAGPEAPRGRPLSQVSVKQPPAPENASVDKPKKRYNFEGSIVIPPPSVESTDVSDDESFMDELQNATVEEARPVAVNRTPVTPVLSKAPTREYRDTTPMNMPDPKARSVSNGSGATTPDKRKTASRAGSARSLSTALPQWPPPSNEPVPALPKQKPALGSSISKRVKTFEGLSQRTDSTVSMSQGKDQTSRSSTISNMLKRASFLAHSSGERTPEKSQPKLLPSPLRSEFETSDEPTEARPLVQRPGTSTEVYSPTHRGESISITARIVRDHSKPMSAHGTSDTWNMHRSPLIVEHEMSDYHSQMLAENSTQSADAIAVTPSSERRRFSFSSHRHTKSPSQFDAKSGRASFAGHSRKTAKSPSETSSIAPDGERASRTSRMLKRLSGIGKRNRDSKATSPTQENLSQTMIQEQAESPEVPMRHVVDIGEVNVQFSETLLWKRRFLRVDDNGYLIFAPPSNELTIRSSRSRKIHLDELLVPTLPDLEREEMAWSILLDLKDGGTVQCACESKSAQASVLKMLIDAHSAYHQLYAADHH